MCLREFLYEVRFSLVNGSCGQSTGDQISTELLCILKVFILYAVTLPAQSKLIAISENTELSHTCEQIQTYNVQCTTIYLSEIPALKKKQVKKYTVLKLGFI